MGGDRSQVVLLEHIFGQEQFHESGFLDWLPILPTMEQLAASGRCIVVITLNDSVLDAVRVQHSHCRLLAAPSLCLARPPAALSLDEKRLILRNHMATAGKELTEDVFRKIVAVDKSGVFYAVRCRRFAEAGGDEAERLRIFAADDSGGLVACGSGPKVYMKILPQIVKKSLLKPTQKVGSWNKTFVGGRQNIRKAFDDDCWTTEGAQRSLETNETDWKDGCMSTSAEDEHPTGGAERWSDPTLHLHSACEKGDLDTVLTLLKSGTDLSQRKNGFTALHTASLAGHVAVVRALLERQCPVEATEDRKRWTSLQLACAGGHSGVAELLIQHGAELERKTPDGMGALHVACRYGHTDTARLLLEKGADVEARQNTGFTVRPLHVAAFYGHAALVQLLMTFQAQTEAADRSGWLPLHYASQEGHLHVVKLLTSDSASQTRSLQLHVDCQNDHTSLVRKLLRCGIGSHDPDGKTGVCTSCYHDNKAALENLSLHYLSPDLPAKDNVTSLFLAAQNGHYTVLDVLLKAGACSEVTTVGSWTPLLVASHNGHARVVRLLLEYKTSVDRPLDDVLLTALHLACRGGHKDVVDVLLLGAASPNVRDSHGYSPLHHACLHGHASLLPTLLARAKEVYSNKGEAERLLSLACGQDNADVVKCLIDFIPSLLSDARGPTAVHAACFHGQCAALKILLEHGFPADAPVGPDVDRGAAPLHVASKAGHDSVAAVLIQFGARVDVANADGDTPLHLACSEGRVGAARLLLDEGSAHVDTENSDGRTALHAAAEKGFDEIVALLLAWKADVNSRDSEQRTPLYLARSHKEVDILLANKADPNIATCQGRTLLHEVCGWGQERIVRSLLLAHVDTEATDSSGQTPLMKACRAKKNRATIVTLLLDSGANVNAGDGAGVTPVHIACSLGDVELLQLLIQHGGDVDCSDKDGERPLHKACIQGHAAVAATLLSAGAEVSGVDNDGNTALHHAASSLQPDVARVLLEHGASCRRRNKAGVSPLRLMQDMKLAEPSYSGHSAHFRPQGGTHFRPQGGTRFPPVMLQGGTRLPPAQHARMHSAESLLQGMLESKQRKEVEENEERRRKLEKRTELLFCFMEYDQRSAQNVPTSAVQSSDRNAHAESSTDCIENASQPATRREATEEGEESRTGDGTARQDYLGKVHQEEKGQEMGTTDGRTTVTVEQREGPMHNDVTEGDSAAKQPDAMASDDEREEGVTTQANSTTTKEDTVDLECGNSHRTGDDEACSEGCRQSQTSVVERQTMTLSRSDANSGLASGVRGPAAGRQSVQRLSGEDCTDPLHAACFQGNTALVLHHLQTFSDVNVASRAGRTALHYACAGGQDDVAALLLRLGADRAARDSSGRCPLHSASFRGHLSTVDLLLTHGVRVNAVDEAGRSALHLAASRGHGLVAAVLLARGAHLDAADHSGNTPLMLAASGGHTQVCVLLLNAGADPDRANESNESARSLVKSQSHPLLATVMTRHTSAGLCPPGATGRKADGFET